MKKINRGFTLIELIIVITIIAILAAVALPRFIDAQRDARAAKANALFGSIRTAAVLARARCELDLVISSPAVNCKTDNGTGGTSVLMDGTAVGMQYGFPRATTAGIGAAAQINLVSDGLTQNISGTGLYYDVIGGTTTRCTINYSPATLSGTNPIPPVITVNTTQC